MISQELLIKDIFQKCIQQNFIITCVESCTGGLVSSALTDVPGASKIYEKGLITYSNESKIELAGVSRETLYKFGAVSFEVISEMAKNCIINKKSKNAITIATSGVAGPDQSERKPVGLIWLATYRHDNLIVKKLCLGNLKRDQIREKTVIEALILLNKNLTV